MTNGHPLADLLKRSRPVFSYAGELGRLFCDELQSGRRGIRYSDHQRHVTTYRYFSKAVLELCETIQHPPDGFKEVAAQLRIAANLARDIRDSMRHSRQAPRYLEFGPDLNTVARDGWQAVNESTKAIRLDDDFAFLDEEPAASPADELAAGEPEKEPAEPSKPSKHTWLALAMLAVKDNPGWSDRQIAKHTGVSPSTLSRSPEYQAAAAMARGNKSDRPSGYIVLDSDGGFRGADRAI